MEEIKEKEAQKVLEELIGSRPEKLTGEAKRLFEAIMKIADERDELLKERQADKEKIKELEAVNKRLRYTMNNAYLLDYIPRKEIEDKIDELTNSKEYFQMFPEDYLAKIGIEILEELLKDGGE